MNNLQKIQEWFAKQCNGVWEHDFGISIISSDNPGWWVKINLQETSLIDKQFDEVSHGVIIFPDKTSFEEERKKYSEMSITHQQDGSVYCTEKNWMHCYVRDKEFNGAGDPTKLEKLLEIFLNWAES